MISQIITVSFRNLVRSPVRSLLILQGVIWGTALGVFPPAVINGSRLEVERKASSLGTNRILIRQESLEKPFDWATVAAIRSEFANRLDDLTGMALLNQSPFTCIVSDDSQLEARGLELAEGRLWGEQRAEPECLIESKLAETLGPKGRIGGTLEVTPGRRFRIVGRTSGRRSAEQLLDEFGYQEDHPFKKLVDQMKRQIGTLSDPDAARLIRDEAVIVSYRDFPSVQPTWIEIRAEPNRVLQLRDELRDWLILQGYDPVIYINAILPFLYGETLKTALELNRAVFVLSIMVGTAVVCVIMILSVVERQREIAIRRVEGAMRWHIAVQFIVETSTVCVVGAVVGVPLGVLLAACRCALEPLDAVTWTFPFLEASIIVILVTVIGLVGGLLPAWRAMRVDPVEMLRYE